MFELMDMASDRSSKLTPQQKVKLAEAEKRVLRTQMALFCNWMHCHCCPMESDMFLSFMSLQCKAR